VGRKETEKQRKTREMLATRWTLITHQAIHKNIFQTPFRKMKKECETFPRFGEI
jgi:hypothetical protein